MNEIISEVLILIAYLLGFFCGYKKSSNKTEQIIPSNPIKAIKAKKEVKKEQEEREHQAEVDKINLENIDNYDGTGVGQIDIPRR